MTNTMQTAKALTFGTELEYTNISRERAVKAIHSVVGGTIRHTGGGYDEWTVICGTRLRRYNYSLRYCGCSYNYLRRVDDGFSGMRC